MSKPIKVIVRKEFIAPADKVFDAWLDSDWLNRWMFGPEVRDEEIIKLENNPEKGGTFSYVVRRGDDIINHMGTYLELNRPSRLVFTWGIEGESEEESTVIIEITSTETGCRLKLTHELDSKWAEYEDRTERGWSFMLDILSEIMN